MGNKIGFVFHRLVERLSDFKSAFTGSWIKPAVILSACVIFIMVSFTVWTKYLSPDARKSRADEQKIAEFINNIELAEKRQREDTFGGETPEETLQLFISALEADDLELASKYFELNEQGERDEEILESIKQSKSSGELPKIIDLLKTAKSAGGWGQYFGFEVLDNNGELIQDIGLSKNEYSGLWKIENM